MILLQLDSDPIGHYEVIELSFSDDTKVEVISEHGFYDVDLNQYVYLDENASYIVHSFLKQSGNSMCEVTLTNVTIETEVTQKYVNKFLDINNDSVAKLKYNNKK